MLQAQLLASEEALAQAKRGAHAQLAEVSQCSSVAEEQHSVGELHDAV
jgi:hypothetical protein